MLVNEWTKGKLDEYECPKNDADDGSKSTFRDMIKPTTDAAFLGGRGNGWYANIIQVTMDTVKDVLLSPTKKADCSRSTTYSWLH